MRVGRAGAAAGRDPRAGSSSQSEEPGAQREGLTSGDSSDPEADRKPVAGRRPDQLEQRPAGRQARRLQFDRRRVGNSDAWRHAARRGPALMDDREASIAHAAPPSRASAGRPEPDLSL